MVRTHRIADLREHIRNRGEERVAPDVPGISGEELLRQAIAKMSESQILAEMANNNTYMVRRNDTLWRISKRFGTTPEHLQRTNDLKSSMIYPGQVLKVPVVATRDR